MMAALTMAWLTALGSGLASLYLARRLRRLQRQVQAAESANATRQRLLAAMGHEMRTPLNGVSGMAGLLLDTDLTPEQQSYATAIESSARALLSIVEEILEDAKITATRTDAAPQAFDPLALVEQVTELLAPRAHAKAISITCHAATNVPRSVKGDAPALRQILLNLAGNAVKFTQTGGVTLKIARAGLPGSLDFIVEDTGPGISPDDRERIFEHFIHGTGAEAGTGLGLAISRDLALRMQGSLTCDPRAKAGSRFILTLPVTDWQEASRDLPRPFTAELLMPQSPAADLFAASLNALGGAVLRRQPQGGRMDLKSSAANHLIIDIAHADLLRAALAMTEAQTLPRIWLLLAPEDRRAAADLLANPRIGHLLKPWRRDTLARALAAKPASVVRQKIWVVEDNPVNARLIRAVLETQGHQVTIHADGPAFRQGLTQDRPALVLMDVELPGESGLSITRRLRRDEQARGLIPLRILALTSHSAATMEAECLAAGMNGMLRKPLQPAELEQLLAAAENRDAA